MKWKQKISNLFIGYYSLKDVMDYYRAMYRKKIYRTSLSFLMRPHIEEQIDFRLKVMKKECYKKGECIHCGCTTIDLQMANKSCEEPCYPTMMNKKDWGKFKNYEYIIDIPNNCRWKKTKTNTLVKINLKK